MKKTFLSLLMLLSALVCCGSSIEDRGLSQFVFYTSPKEVIARLDQTDRVLSAEEHYMLGNAYLAEKDQKKALLHFANSCFTSKRNMTLRLYPQPVHEFVTSFGVKSGCRQDALYNIALIMYGYRELDYVIKFCQLEDDELLRGDFALLRGKALMAQKKHDQAISFYEDVLDERLPADDRALLLIRLGACYETRNRKEDALKAFSQSLTTKPDGWQAPIAARNLARLGLDNPSVLYGIAPQLCKGLMAAGKYDKLLVFTQAYLKDRGVSKGEVLDAHVRALVDRNLPADIDTLMESHPDLKNDILFAKADRLWQKNRRTEALGIFSELLKNNFRVRDYAGRCGYYYYDRNKSESDRYMQAYADAGEPESLAEQYLWMMSKNFISQDNLAGARPLLERIVKEYPDGNYAGNARFWLYKLLKDKEPAVAERLIKDLVIHNNSSTYCWRILGEISKTGNADQYLASYRQALSANNQDAVYYHTLLSYLERDGQAIKERQEELNSAGMNPLRDMIDLLENERYESEYEDYLKRLKGYFLLADGAGIKRVLDSLPDNDDLVKQDKFAALARYAKVSGNYYYGILGVIGLGNTLKVDENLFLLPGDWGKIVIPRGFQEMVDVESKNYNLENWKFYAIIKAESLFDPNAVSGAGARGLMQIMPATARGIARQLRIEKYDLLEPSISVKFGGQYMGWLERTFKGNYTDMVAAYNAGPGNLKKWRDQYAGSDEDAFVEKIPFAETRFYVLRTGKFLEQYRYFYSVKDGSE